MTCTPVSISAFNDNFLRAQRHGFLVSVYSAHAVQTDFLLQNKAALNNKNFLDNGDDRRVAFFSNRWNGIDGAPYRSPLNLKPLLNDGFINEFLMRDRANVYPNVPLYLAARYRKILTVERKNLLLRYDLGRDELS